MLLDFSTLETCTETLDAVTTIPLEDILMIDKSYGNNTYSNEWIEEYINFDIFENKSMIDTTFFHLTTTGKIDEITKNGLQNLQTVLSTDNFLTDFFKKYDIQFDIEKERIVNNNRIIDLDNIEFSNPFYRIKNRVYFDYNINGFYYFNTEHSIIVLLMKFQNLLMIHCVEFLLNHPHMKKSGKIGYSKLIDMLLKQRFH